MSSSEQKNLNQNQKTIKQNNALINNYLIFKN